MKSIIKSSIILLVIDTIYLSLFAAKPFKLMVERIQNKKVTVNYVYAAITYILLMFAFNYFIINKKFTYTEAFFLGTCIYGVFDFTNLALFSNYDIRIGLQDSIWGGILFALSLYIYNLV